MRVAASMRWPDESAAYHVGPPPPAAQAAAEPNLQLNCEASVRMVMEQLSIHAQPMT